MENVISQTDGMTCSKSADFDTASNALGWTLWKTSPVDTSVTRNNLTDADKEWYVYDVAGRLVKSKDKKQTDLYFDTCKQNKFLCSS